MGSSDGGYDLVELFVLKFVLADVIIIATLLLVGPLAAAAITALLVVSTLLLWYVTRDEDEGASAARERRERTATATEDPVTALQRRYAKGELTEREFERRLDQLLAADERAAEADVETERLSLNRDR